MSTICVTGDSETEIRASVVVAIFKDTMAESIPN